MSPFNGPLRVSANGRYFVDAAGQPFFWLGDTAWPLYANYTLRDAEQYLARRARQGFSVIQGVLAWGGGSGFEANLPDADENGQRPWQTSPAEPNEAYFQRVEQIVRIAAEQGLVLAMLPTWGYYVNDIGLFTIENAVAYGRWLGARYREAPNIVWILGGDRVPTGYEPVYRAMGNGLRQGDGGAHLMSYHTCGSTSTGQFWHNEDWLAFNMIQTWTQWDRIHPAVIADALRTPTKPVVLAEGAYEQGPEYPLGPITPLLVRRQAWWTFTGGGFHTYGHNDNWRMQPNWLSMLDSPGAAQMTHFREIATSRKWWQFSPSQCVFAAGASEGRTLNTALRSADSRCILIYLSSQCHVRLNLFEIATRQVRLTWVNPRDGEQRDGGVYATGNRTGQRFPSFPSQWFATPDYWEDAVLIMDGLD